MRIFDDGRNKGKAKKTQLQSKQNRMIYKVKTKRRSTKKISRKQKDVVAADNQSELQRMKAQGVEDFHRSMVPKFRHEQERCNTPTRRVKCGNFFKIKIK